MPQPPPRVMERAFTGAETETTGPFEAADGGTVFLDEAEETSMRTQVKSLRDGETRKPGSAQSKKVNVWVIYIRIHIHSERNRWNKSQTAKDLKVHRAALWLKIKERSIPSSHPPLPSIFVNSHNNRSTPLLRAAEF